MSVGQRSLFGMLTGAGSVVIKAGLNILLIPIIIAKLGLDQFGLYILLIALFEVAILLDLGATGALVALLGGSADQERQRRSYLKTGNLLLGALSVFLLATGLAVVPWFADIFNIAPALQGTAQTGFSLVLLEAVLTLYSCYGCSVLLAHCAHQWSNLADTLYALIANVGAVIALLNGGDLVTVMALRLAAAIVRLILINLYTHRIEPFAFFPKTGFCAQSANRLLRLSGHAMMINFSIIMSHKIDDIVIARFLPLSAVGIYEIVFRFLGVIIQICLKLHEGIYPLFAKMSALRQTAEARQLFLRMSCFFNLAACLMMLLIVLFYRELFLIFSAGKVPVEQTLPILAVAVPCVLSGVLQMPANAFLFTSGQQRFLSVTSILAALANLTLSLILVHSFGLVGVALGTLIPQLIQHQWGLIGKTCRHLEISFLQYVRSVYGAILLPLFASFVWVTLWRTLLPVNALNLFSIALIASGAMLIGGLLWFRLTATPSERQLVSITLSSRLPKRFSQDKSSALTVDNA